MDSTPIGAKPVTSLNVGRPKANGTQQPLLSRRSVRPVLSLRRAPSRGRDRLPQRMAVARQSSAPSERRPAWPWLWRAVVVSVSVHGLVLLTLTVWRWVVVTHEETPVWFDQPVELLRVGNITGDIADVHDTGETVPEAVELAHVPLFIRPSLPAAATALPNLEDTLRPVSTPVIAVDVERAPRGVMFAVPHPVGSDPVGVPVVGAQPGTPSGDPPGGLGRGRWGGLVRVAGQKPDYPALARENGWEGAAVLRFEVREDGSVGSIDVVSSSGYAVLDDAACEAVRRWRFVPIKRDGHPIRVVVEQTITFRLDRS